MIKEGKFGIQEAICLVTITISNKIFFTAPGRLTEQVGTAGYQMTLVSCTMATFLFTIIYILLKRFPGMGIVEIFNMSLGNVVGYIFSFVLMLFFLISTGILLREFTDILKSFTFHLTPIGVLNLSGMIVISLAAYLGLETIARFSSLAAKASLFTFILLMLLASKDYHLSHIFPIWGYGIGTTVITGLKRTSAFSEILIFGVIASSLQGASHIKKAGYISLLFSGIILSVSIFCYTLAFDYTTNQELISPFFVLVRVINYGAFVQRMDPLLMFVWIVTTLITLSILFYCAISVFCKMHKINDTRPVILPMAVLVLTIAIFPSDLPSVAEIYIPQQRDLGQFILVFFPIIALIASVLRKKRGGSSNS
jgi:spore germination protein KB